MLQLRLYLYVVVNTPHTNKIINELTTILDKDYGDGYFLEIIDLLLNPEAAIQDDVFVTPTLIKVRPEPVKRIIGDLSDGRRALGCLGIRNN